MKINTLPRLAYLLLAIPLFAQANEMAQIEGGSYRPLYLKKDTPMTPVKSFKIDKYPVSNQDFYTFVQKNPQWQRGNTKLRQAEQNYLTQWEKNGSAYGPKATDKNKPVTNVSWFAANAYCRAQGKRLPTIDEWEYVAQASQFKKNGTTEANFSRIILDWYAEGGKRGLVEIGKSPANYWGVYDLHGLIWEWTEDFNSSLLNSASADSSLYCGSASAGSTDPSNYAAFMRYGMRTSLQATFTLNNLGFRCASSK